MAQSALSPSPESHGARVWLRSLVHRTSRGIVPTESGVRLANRARSILADVGMLAEEVRGVEAAPAGSVSVGMPTSLGIALTVPLAMTVRPAISARPASHIGRPLRSHVPMATVWTIGPRASCSAARASRELRRIGWVRNTLIWLAPKEPRSSPRMGKSHFPRSLRCLLFYQVASRLKRRGRTRGRRPGLEAEHCDGSRCPGKYQSTRSRTNWIHNPIGSSS